MTNKNNHAVNFDLLGGKLIDPKSGFNKKADIYIRKGKIYHSSPEEKHSYPVYNIDGQVVLPGLLDLRAHNRIPGASKSENIESLTNAAAKGGFSAILLMPDTKPHCDNPATIRFIQDRVKQTSKIRVYLSGCLTVGSRGESIAPLGSLKDVGVVVVTDCPATTVNNEILTNAIKYAKMFGLVVFDFPQDAYLSRNSHAHESALSLKMGLVGNPRLAEEIAVQRAILISRHLETRIHLSSLSSSGSVELVRKAKESGIEISADVSAHHLLLTESQILNYNTSAKVNPPLRQKEDQDALLDGIKNGVIDGCNSSHEPFADHLKEVEYDIAPAGAIGLETAALTFIEALRDNDPYELVVEKMCYNPHKILGISVPSLQENSEANFVVINPGASWVYDPKKGESLSHNSPLSNYKFSNKISMTLSEGKIAYLCKSVS